MIIFIALRKQTGIQKPLNEVSPLLTDSQNSHPSLEVTTEKTVH